MKKLIKDLTQKEIKRICKKHYENNDNCIGCPFYESTIFKYMSCVSIPKEIKEFNEYINKEVDVPDESKEEK